MLKSFSHITRTQRKHGGQTPLILNLDTLWNWVISFKIGVVVPHATTEGSCYRSDKEEDE